MKAKRGEKMKYNKKVKIKQNRRDKILSGKYPILLDDQVFKFIFSHEELAKYLLDALSDYLNLDLKYGRVLKSDPQKLDMADSVLKQDFYHDVLVSTDNGDIILFEAYNKFRLKEYRKSEAYLDRVSSSNYEKNKSNNFTSDKKAICFNFAPRNKTNKAVVKKYGVVDLDTLKEPFKRVHEHKQMYLIGVDTYKTKEYNENERLLEILDFMNRNTMDELRELAKGGNIFMEQTLKFLEDYLADESNKGYGSLYDYDVEEAREEGERAGRKAGRKAGIKAEKIATAKNLINLGSNNDFIAKATGLKENIIEKLRIN